MYFGLLTLQKLSTQITKMFGFSKPKITKEEMRIMRNTLHTKLDATEWAQVEMLFNAALEEPGIKSGISKNEFEQGIQWLKNNQSAHHLSAEEISALETEGGTHLKD